MKKLNVLHPWLPQSYPTPQAIHPNLNKEIREAKRLAQKAAQRVSVLRRKHMVLQKRLVGPSTVEMIVLTGQYERAKQERRIAVQKLYTLLSLRRTRNNGKSKKK